VPSYPADDIPPGSALGMELLGDGHGKEYVRVFYRAQTMDQLREQRKLTGEEKPFRQYLPVPGCGDSEKADACPLDDFVALVGDRRKQ
jgi:4-phytase/acid phosphatase